MGSVIERWWFCDHRLRGALDTGWRVVLGDVRSFVRGRWVDERYELHVRGAGHERDGCVDVVGAVERCHPDSTRSGQGRRQWVVWRLVLVRWC